MLTFENNSKPEETDDNGDSSPLQPSTDKKMLKEGVMRKHAADRESDPSSQITLYLEAVVYFLLSGEATERDHGSQEAALTIYKKTIDLIKFILTECRIYKETSNATRTHHQTHNKVAILSLRCQAIITLKLYKMKKNLCRYIRNKCSEFFENAKPDDTIDLSGNLNDPATQSLAQSESSVSEPTPTSSSLCADSNTQPGTLLSEDIYTALKHQNQFFIYLTNSFDLWEHAGRLIRKGHHADFFKKLDHKNGPLTLQSESYEVFRYVQAGLKQIRDNIPLIQSQSQSISN